jgi:hypothetical protein
MWSQLASRLRPPVSRLTLGLKRAVASGARGVSNLGDSSFSGLRPCVVETFWRVAPRAPWGF